MSQPPDRELVVDFLNTVDVEKGTDVLDDAAAWQRWVHQRELGVPDTPRGARTVRDALRSAVLALEADPAATPWDGRVLLARLERGRPALTAPDALGAVVAAAVRLSLTDDWDRVKICPADECRWAFFDRSKNRSRTWCSMQVCGNRDKARNWRARTRVT